MSVMQQLQATAGQGNNFPRFGRQNGIQKQQLQDAQEMMMAAPIPGQSLTQNPESRLPYERPPKFTDIQDFIDETFIRFTDEEAMPDLLDSMRMGLPVEYIAEKYLNQAFRKGEITPDMLMLCIEPTIYMLISVATYANIDPVLYPEDEMLDEVEDEVHTDLYRKASKELLADSDIDEDTTDRLTVQDIQAPANIPRSLLARTEEAVGRVQRKGEMR